MQRTRKLILSIALVTVILFSTAGIYAEDSRTGINRNDLIYFVFTDRFNDGDTSNDEGADKKDPAGYHGGDIQGIIDKLDYIKDLGFTTVWISPVVQNQLRGYHGYWCSDFYQTNEHFGDMDKVKELVRTAHSKNMKVMFDLVVNHVGQMHPWIEDPQYKDWFHTRGNITDYNNQQEVEEGKLSGLPDLNQENPEVEKYLTDMAKWWIRETGIDGYRLDTVKHVSKSFWKDFSAEIKKDYPDFYLMGEVWHGDINYVADYQNTGLDGLADFPMYYKITEVFKDFKPAVNLADAINNSGKYPNRYLMGTFIDNHDVPRYVDQLYKFRDEKLKQALAFMMTYTGIPIMYYGTEIGLEGGADPDNRRDMDWNAKSPVADYVKKLASIRKSNSALTQGDIKVLKADKNFICYARTDGDNTVLVLFNTALKENDQDLDLTDVVKQQQGTFVDLLNEGVQFSIDQNSVKVNMAPLQVNILSFNNKAPAEQNKESLKIGDSTVTYLIAGGIATLAALVIVFLFIGKKKKISG